MEYSVLCQALREFTTGLLNQLLVNLAGQDGQIWLEELKKFLRKEPCWSTTVAEKLLEFVTSVSTTAVKRFVVADFFGEGKTVEGVEITYLSPNFKKLFLPKSEENLEAVDIRVHKLTKNSKDLGIRAEIGETNEEIQLTHFWQVLKARSAGNTNIGTQVIGYITGVDGNLWAVGAGWGVDGWYLDAGSVEGPCPWGAGGLVCSR